MSEQLTDKIRRLDLLIGIAVKAAQLAMARNPLGAKSLPGKALAPNKAVA